MGLLRIVEAKGKEDNMTDNKLRNITVSFERIIEKAKKIKANKKLTDDERGAIINGIKEEFVDALLELEYVIDTPGYRDPAYEVQESFCLKAQDLSIIKDKKELDDIFMEIYKIKKAKREDGDELKAIKKEIDKAIKAKDVKKLAYISYDIIKEVTKLTADTEEYLFAKMYNAKLEKEVDEEVKKIKEREEEKEASKLEREISEYEARLRTLERKHEKEYKKELASIGRRARSAKKTLLSDAKGVREREVVRFESPGFCQYCHKKIEDVFYHYDPRTGEMMHKSCYALYKEEKEREEEIR